jgi:hypothetical protein
MPSAVGHARFGWPVAIAGLVLSLAAAAEAAAQELPKLLMEKSGRNPYASLFTGKAVQLQQPPVERERQAEEPGKPFVVCGMVMIPTDDRIDPKMRVAPREDENSKNVNYTMRALKPPMCTTQ